MKIRGFLVVLILGAVVVYFLWMAKAGKDKVVEEVKVFKDTKQQLTEVNMFSLAREIQSYTAMQGRTPKSLKEFQALRTMPVSALDAWGKTIRYERLSDEDFRLISAGADGEFDTSDDIVKDY